MPFSGTDARARARRARNVVRALPAEWAAAFASRAEIAALRREHPGVAADATGLERPDTQRIMIVFLSDNAEEARLQGLLAKVLQRRGAQIQILATRAGARAGAIFRALRLRNIVYAEDFVLGRFEEHLEEADRILAATGTTRSLVAYEHDGVRIGRHAISTAVRQRLDPSIDFANTDVREAVRRNLAIAIEGIERARRILDATTPDQLLLIERGYVSFAPIFDVALQRGISVVQLQAAHRDDALQLKRYRLDLRELHPRSLDEATWRALQEAGWTETRAAVLEAELAAREEGKWFMARRLRHSSGARGADDLRRRLGLDRERKVAVLFSHLLWDASMFYWDDLYPDQGAWFAETVRLAAERDDVQWLVKLHPALYWKLRANGGEEPAELRLIREAVGTLPPHMRLVQPTDDVDNRDLFQVVDAGVTIRGTVGLELPRLGIPVLTAGTSDYAGRGFTVDSSTIAEYEANVRSISGLLRLSAEQIATANLYAYGIFCVRPWPIASFVQEFLPAETEGDTLAPRIGYRVHDDADLDSAGDLRTFADWVLDSADPDFVNVELLRS
jgi:hypothetical protein